jgi:prevent-host-death family protein
METLSVSEFKAKCLSVLQDVNKQKKRVIITKRGKPIAEVIPHESEDLEFHL